MEKTVDRFETERSEDQEDTPFIPAKKRIPELTLAPLVAGVILGVIFGFSSLYLALKVGLTVSASIPVAVLSITIFRWLSRAFGLRNATILENNIVQTAGSAGESIAFGVAVTMPALLILGFDIELTRVMIVASLGALLGILMMIPLRYALVVKSKKELVFPEGTACAEVLIAGEKGGTSAEMVFGGFFFGLIYKFLNVGAKLWNDVPESALNFFKGATFSTEVSPELLGVGYIIGPRIACIMVAGGILSSWVLIPMIRLFGDHLTTPLFPATELISKMSVHDIWKNYVLYIGAGAVAAAGIVSLGRSLPTIIRSAKASFMSLVGAGSRMTKTLRTELDLPIHFVLGGILILVAAITMTPSLHMNVLGGILIILSGFLFVAVSSRLTGEVGSSSNPVSGMTVATLLFTSLVFLAMGWTSPEYRVAALSVAAIVCVAASNAGATAQDLKTGHIVGATPRNQQIAILIGALASALVIGYTLNTLNDASTVYSKKAVPVGAHFDDVGSLKETARVEGPEASKDQNLYHVLRVGDLNETGPLAGLQPGKYLVDDSGKIQYFVDPGINGVLKTRDDGTAVQKYEAPKARLMSLIIDGILKQKLPWALVLLGVAISIVLELCGISSLAFAVGVYLPLSASSPIFFGGMARLIVDEVRRRRAKSKGKKDEEESGDSAPGVLYSSGLIAGGSIGGIALAVITVKENWLQMFDWGSKVPRISGSDITSYVLFAIMLVGLIVVGSRRTKPLSS